MTLNSAKLTVTADADGDGTDETGVFELKTDVRILPGVRTGYLVGPRGSRVHSIITNQTDPGEDGRKNFVLDLGGGVHQITIEFTGFEGSSQQWGNDSSATLTAASATGQDPASQVSVLMRYLTVGEADSRTPATLEYGEYSSSGKYDALDVAIEEPQLTLDYSNQAEDVSSFSGELTCLVIADLKETWDAAQRDPRGPQ